LPVISAFFNYRMFSRCAGRRVTAAMPRARRHWRASCSMPCRLLPGGRRTHRGGMSGREQRESERSGKPFYCAFAFPLNRRRAHSRFLWVPDCPRATPATLEDGSAFQSRIDRRRNAPRLAAGARQGGAGSSAREELVTNILPFDDHPIGWVATKVRLCYGLGG
jgi:hypothetical protein